MDEVRLSVRLQSFRYPDGTEALKNISLQIKKGEFIGILGANGSGKTSLLRVMDGLLKDFIGEILLDGREIKKLSPREIYREIGLVFQNPDDQLFSPTVWEDVAFGPTNMGFAEDEIRSRVTQALQQVEMENFKDKSIHNLSFGQKKRVCIAGLLAMGHTILFLDEPTAGLDPLGEYKMVNLLTQLNRERKVTILLATHSVDLVPLFIDKLYILDQGIIVRGGTTEEIFTTPEGMSDVQLRLPQVAELIYRLKHEDHVPFDKIPYTIGEARKEIVQLLI